VRTFWIISMLSAVAVAACGHAPGSAVAAIPGPESDMVMPADSPSSSQGLGREPVHLTIAQARAIGVTYAMVEHGRLTRAIRTVGQVNPAEPNLADITPKIDGFVEELYADQTGVEVHHGDPLLTLYSPMLVAAEQELLTADRLLAGQDSTATDAWRNATELVAAARRRLANFDISPDQIARLEQTGEVTRTLTLRAPFDGVILDKMVVRGQSVMAGMAVYRLADLSTVWVEGDVFEQDLATVRVGTPARVEADAYPGQVFTGRVSFVSPTVDPRSRTGTVRVVLANPQGVLKPGMYATIFADAAVGDNALSLPSEAVIRTGERDLVFVAAPNGMLTAREVVVGQRAGDRLQILSGLAAGDRVVASANFLVDAESRLGDGGAMASMPGMTMPAMAMPGMTMPGTGKETSGQ
jgi:membrane fusion protein, copper/silver efflux system